MSLNTQPYKGTRDFYPEDMRLRNYMYDTWRQVCQSFGYEETSSPVLEPIELYTAKTSEEIVNEQSYSFTDRGGRKMIMRPEMTPSISRMVAARRQELAYPLRVFNICNYFRYEKPQKGRLREFWQLNADLFGVQGIQADVEVIQLADALMKSFGAVDGSYEIKINSRVMMDMKIKAADPIKPLPEVTSFLDKKDKMSEADFYAKLADYVGNVAMIKEWLNSTDKRGNDDELYALKDRLEKLGVSAVKIDPTVTRGFNYYTDIVFEVFDTNPENNRSMFGGGRYDGLVGLFGVESIPTVGFAMGDATLENFLESNNLKPDLKNSTDLVLITIGDVFSEASKLANELRQKGLNVSLDSTDRKIDKKIKVADKQGVKYVLFIGESELKDQKFNLKNLKTGEETNLTSLNDIYKKLADKA